jgi:ABC-type sugar transport system ATPase subunit
MVYVTHDQVEAMTFADRIVVMNHGRIAQAGKPFDLYYHPDNLFVAGYEHSGRRCLPQGRGKRYRFGALRDAIRS